MGCPPGGKLAMGELKVGCIILAIVLEALGAEWTSCAPGVGTCQKNVRMLPVPATCGD